MIVRTRRGDYAATAERGVIADAIRARMGAAASSIATDPEALAAVSAAVEWVAGQVAVLPLRVWRGRGLDRVEVTTTWQARLLAGEPAPEDTWYGLLEQTAAAIELDGNAFWVKLLDEAGRVAQVFLAPRGSVVASRDPKTRRKVYVVLAQDGRRAVLSGAEVIHFRGPGWPGKPMAPSRLVLHASTLDTLAAKVAYERDLYANGAGQSLAVTFPFEVKPQQIRQYRQVFQEEHATDGKRGRVKVFGGGATVSSVGISPADAELVASLGWGVADVARAFGVPLEAVHASLAGGDNPDASRKRWRETGLPRRLACIVEALRGDAALFGPASRDYPAFDLRGTLLDPATIKELVQVGVLVPDEGRAELGYAPLPDGVGLIPQVTPVGGAPNQAPPAPPALPPADPSAASRATDARIAAAVVREAATIDAERQARADAHVADALARIGEVAELALRSVEAARAAAELRAEIIVNVEPTPVQVDAPIVNVDAAPVEVVVNVPETAPPVVNVLPATPGVRELVITRDQTGRLTGGTLTEQD